MIESVSVTIENTPEIHVAATVIAGAPGKDAYQSYLETTDDDPPLTEEEWSAGVGGGGTVDAAAIAAITHAATAKDTPVDDDEVGLADSAATYGWKKLKWSAIKATLKAYFDTLYQTTAVTWSTLSGKPSTFPPTIGTGAADAVAGNDSRLTNSRTPTAHKSTHATGGSDALSPSDIGAATAAQGAKADSAIQAADLETSSVDYANTAGSTPLLQSGTIAGTLTFNSTSITFGTGAEAALRDALDIPASDPTGITGADAISNIVSLTAAEYAAITPNSTTLYIVT